MAFSPPRSLIILCLAVALGPAGCRNSPRLGPVLPADPFLEVTQSANIRTVRAPAIRPTRLLESVGCGGGFLDYDADGLQDILVVGSPTCALYRNQGGGKFEDVSEQVGLARLNGPWIGCAVGDYDNDGYPDLFVTGYLRSMLLHNDGGRGFGDVTRSCGLDLGGRWTTAAAFADFDRDGRLDLYVGAYCRFTPASRQYCVLHENGVKTACRPIDYDAEIGKCFRNLGGRFQDVTAAWGLDHASGKTLGVAVGDYDSDGWPDLYLANDETPANLFHNNGGHGFTDVAVECGAAYGEGGQLMGGMGVDWGDYDGDGRPDLAVGTFEGEKKALFRNLDGKAFEFTSGNAGILAATYADVTFGTLFFDYDGDGRPDLATVSGHTMDNVEAIRPTMSFRQPGRLFRNRGEGAFEAVVSPTFGRPIAGRALACGDYDNDGRPDLLEVDMDGPVRLLHNQSGSGAHWLRVELEGTRSNRQALGARVTVAAGGHQQVGEVRSSRSYLSACDTRLLFGVGSAQRIDSLEVAWPSGLKSVRRDVPVDQAIRIKEAS